MRIVVIGFIAPPVTGASIMTQAMVDFLEDRRNDVKVLNASPIAGRSKLVWHLSRIAACLRNTFKVLSEARGTTVYYVPSGGMGLFYDVLVVAACALRGHSMIFQHHSFAYIDKTSPLMKIIVALSGPKQKHIANSLEMKRRFGERYGAALSVTAISNLALLPALAAPNGPVAKNGGITLGYLSNIMFEKGIDRFLDVLECLQARGSKVKGRIAGPFTSDAVKTYVEDRLSRLKDVEHVGPVYGEKKDAFFRSLDVFVFPSRYVNEAQPLVVYEAQAAGLRLAVTDRGCLPDMIGAGDILLDSEAKDVEPVVEAVLEMERGGEDGDLSGAAVARRRAAFVERVHHEIGILEAFFTDIDGQAGCQ